jgi:hypothetical protein
MTFLELPAQCNPLRRNTTRLPLLHLLRNPPTAALKPLTNALVPKTPLSLPGICSLPILVSHFFASNGTPISNLIRRSVTKVVRIALLTSNTTIITGQCPGSPCKYRELVAWRMAPLAKASVAGCFKISYSRRLIKSAIFTTFATDLRTVGEKLFCKNASVGITASESVEDGAVERWIGLL